jgi:hypothetical protein
VSTVTPIRGERPAGRRRRLAASAAGGERTQAIFAEVLTRRRYCEAVGVHPNTLVRWEQAGVVKPEMREVGDVPTRVFTEAQVAFGIRLRQVLAENNGRLSLAEAAKLARRRST